MKRKRVKKRFRDQEKSYIEEKTYKTNRKWEKRHLFQRVVWTQPPPSYILSSSWSLWSLLSSSHYALRLGIQLLKTSHFSAIIDLIETYNTYMGGIHTPFGCEYWCLLNCGPRKKCLSCMCAMPILFWLVDIVVNNAILLAKSYGAFVDTLEFRRSVNETLLMVYGMPRVKPGPKNLQQ